MNFKRFLPAIHNLLPAFILTSIYWAYRFVQIRHMCMVVKCAHIECGYDFVRILPNCCGCYDYSVFFTQLIFVIVMPFLAVYIASSIIAMVYDANKIK